MRIWPMDQHHREAGQTRAITKDSLTAKVTRVPGEYQSEARRCRRCQVHRHLEGGSRPGREEWRAPTSAPTHGAWLTPGSTSWPRRPAGIGAPSWPSQSPVSASAPFPSLTRQSECVECTVFCLLVCGRRHPQAAVHRHVLGQGRRAVFQLLISLISGRGAACSALAWGPGVSSSNLLAPTISHLADRMAIGHLFSGFCAQNAQNQRKTRMTTPHPDLGVQ